jgi:TonB family protein
MPAYPQAALDQKIEGIVVLHTLIAGDGTVKDITPVSGSDILSQSAIETVKRWQYQTAQLNGIAIEMDTMVGLRYALGPPPTVTIDNEAASKAQAADTTAFRAPSAPSSPAVPHGQPLTDAPSVCDLSFVATHYSETYQSQTVIPDIPPSDFSARLDTAYVNIWSAGIDAGPKRIGIVIDASRAIPNDEWERQIQLAANFIEHARPQDSLFVFLTSVDVAPEKVASPSATADRLRRLMFSHPSASDSTERNYDALLATGASMQPPRFGDTLMLFGHAEDIGSSTNSDRLQDLILKNRMRLIVMSFSTATAGKSSGLDTVTRDTGYFIDYHDTLSLNQPGQLVLMENYMRDLYGWIAGPYRLKVESTDVKTPVDLTVYLSDAAQRNIRDFEIHYPRRIYPCSAAATP